MKILRNLAMPFFGLPVECDANESSINNQRAGLHQQSPLVEILAEKVVGIFADMMEAIFEALHLPVEWQLWS